MEDLFQLIKMLLSGDLIYKIDVKDAYFATPLAKNSRNM